MSTRPPVFEQFADSAPEVVAASGARWMVAVVVGFSEDDAGSLGDAAGLTADLVADVNGMAARWIVLDIASGASCAGGGPHRLAALQQLRAHYRPSAETGHDAPNWAGERRVLVSRHTASGRYRLLTVEDPTRALRVAGEDVLDGWKPLAIFDLDAREMIELRVATTVVTPSGDQGSMTNPLAETA